MSHWLKCLCQKYVKAQKCSGNNGDDAYVPEDKLPPGGGGFCLENSGGGRDCYYIDPTDPKVCLPRGAKVADGPFSYFQAGDEHGTEKQNTCTECDNDEDPNQPGGEPCSDTPPGPGGGGGIGGGGGGGSGGCCGGGVRKMGSGGGVGTDADGDGDTDPPVAYEIKPCPDHTSRYDGPTLHVLCDENTEEDYAGYIFRWGGICWKVQGSCTERSVDDYGWTSVPDQFEQCDDCSKGICCRICPDQNSIPGIDEAPDIWVRQQDLPASSFGFLFKNFCYVLNTNDPLEVIPLDAFIGNPSKQSEGCDDCDTGVQATLCSGQGEVTLEKELWVPSDWLEQMEIPTGVTDDLAYFRYYGSICFSIDPNGTPSRIPFDADIAYPRSDGFVSCQECICGEPRGDWGIPASPCNGQDGVQSAVQDIWVHEDEVPTGSAIPGEDDPDRFIYFLVGFLCYFADLRQTVREMPVGAVIANTGMQYLSCDDCTTRGSQEHPGENDPPQDTDGGGDGGDDEDDLCNKPNPPSPPCPGGGPGGGGGGSNPTDFPPHRKYCKLTNCSGDATWDGYYVPETALAQGTVADDTIYKDEGCYTVGSPVNLPAGANLLSGYETIDDCDDDRCEGAAPCGLKDGSELSGTDCNGNAFESGVPYASKTGGCWYPLATSYQLNLDSQWCGVQGGLGHISETLTWDGLGWEDSNELFAYAVGLFTSPCRWAIGMNGCVVFRDSGRAPTGGYPSTPCPLSVCGEDISSVNVS